MIPVLIEGPTGSGKELVARALHRLSGRTGKFLAVNVSAVPESLFESSFFGHARGSFTGAVADKKGLLSQADRGTLFLDEISTLAGAGQAKLLRALETKEFMGVGAESDAASAFRLVAATNERLSDLVAEGRFRADLLYRIGHVRILVPALADRRADIPDLVRSFLGEKPNGEERCSFRPCVMAALQEHTWPGNVRELRAIIELLAVVGRRADLDGSSVSAAILGDIGTLVRTATRISTCGVSAELVQNAISSSGGDTRLAADVLGVSRSHLYRILGRFGMDPPRRARN